MKIIELGEKPYENGRKIGSAFAAYLHTRKSEFEEKLNDPRVYDDVKKGEQILKREFPELLEELYGKADASEISADVILLMAMPEILRKKSGCTTIMRRNEDGTISFSHNEDEWYSEFNPESTALLRYHFKDLIITGYTSAYKTVGSCFGFRSDGLIISCNHLASDELNLDYGSRYLLSAKMYFVKNYEEAVNTVRNMRPASAFHVNLADTVSGRACSMERDIHDCTVTELKDILVHSNHFLHKKGKADVCSLFRYEKPWELLKTTDDLKEILSYTSTDHDHTIRMTDPFHKGWEITSANLTYDPKSDTVVIKDENENTEMTIPLRQ